MGLENVKVGDKIVCRGALSTVDHLYTVERVTKTMAVCERGASFMLRDGLMKGTAGGRGWDRRYGRLCTPEDEAAIRLKIRIRAASERIRSFTVTESNLEAVEALIASAAGAK